MIKVKNSKICRLIMNLGADQWSMSKPGRGHIYSTHGYRDVWHGSWEMVSCF